MKQNLLISALVAGLSLSSIAHASAPTATITLDLNSLNVSFLNGTGSFDPLAGSYSTNASTTSSPAVSHTNSNSYASDAYGSAASTGNMTDSSTASNGSASAYSNYSNSLTLAAGAVALVSINYSYSFSTVSLGDYVDVNGNIYLSGCSADGIICNNATSAAYDSTLSHLSNNKTGTLITALVNGTGAAETVSLSAFAGTNVTSAIPVPEPQIYAMMMAGLGLTGFVARRRRGKNLI